MSSIYYNSFFLAPTCFLGVGFCVFCQIFCVLSQIEPQTLHQLVELFFLRMFKQVRNSFMFTFLKKSFLEPCNLHQWEGWSWTKCILATQAVPSLSPGNSLCLCPESTVFYYLDSSLHFGEAHLEKLLRVGVRMIHIFEKLLTWVKFNLFSVFTFLNF